MAVKEKDRSQSLSFALDDSALDAYSSVLRLEAAAMAEDFTVSSEIGLREEALSPQVESYQMYVGLTAQEIENLHIIGLCFSSLSFLASVTSLYWLVRMRRSFRHE